MTGPDCVSIIIRCGIPRPKRDADSNAVIAVAVSADSACNGACDREEGLEVEVAVDKIGVSARSARCWANGLLEGGRFAIFQARMVHWN